MAEIQTNAPVKKILFLTTGLSSGGAEMMLYKLLCGMNRQRFEPVVISLMNRGTLGDRIESLGVPVHSLGMKAGVPTLLAPWQLIGKIRQIQPDLIQGWMSHSNLAAQSASIFASKPIPILWNIRHSVLSRADTKLSTLFIINLLSYLSYLPAKIIYNSKVGAEGHQQIGYRSDKTTIIPNGFDTQLFAPSAEARSIVRAELNLPEDTFLIGRMGRFHPMKDPGTFLQAAALLLEIEPDVHFLLVGRKMDWENQLLQRLIKELSLSERIHLLGERQDIPRLTAALDIASSSSYSEGFANVIGEAMSCGVLCVVTDAGDSAWIVGETGRVVPIRDPNALCAAWIDLIKMETLARRELGARARERIKAEFSIEAIVKQYEKLYEEQLYGI